MKNLKNNPSKNLISFLGLFLLIFCFIALPTNKTKAQTTCSTSVSYTIGDTGIVCSMTDTAYWYNFNVSGDTITGIGIISIDTIYIDTVRLYHGSCSGLTLDFDTVFTTTFFSKSLRLYHLNSSYIYYLKLSQPINNTSNFKIYSQEWNLPSANNCSYNTQCDLITNGDFGNNSCICGNAFLDGFVSCWDNVFGTTDLFPWLPDPHVAWMGALWWDDITNTGDGEGMAQTLSPNLIMANNQYLLHYKYSCPDCTDQLDHIFVFATSDASSAFPYNLTYTQEFPPSGSCPCLELDDLPNVSNSIMQDRCKIFTNTTSFDLQSVYIFPAASFVSSNWLAIKEIYLWRINAGDNMTIYCGAQAQLGCPPTTDDIGATFSWTSSPSDASLTGQSTSPNPLVSPTITTIYTLTVTDCESNTATATVTVTVVSPITATITTTPVSCNVPFNDGTALISPSGGSSPYSYVWSPSVSFSNTASNLTVGAYSVTVSDANLCSAVFSVDVTTDPSCCYDHSYTDIVPAIGWDFYSTTSYSHKIILVNGDIRIHNGGYPMFDHCDFIMAPGVSIYVMDHGEMAMDYCHLYACNDIWNGIVETCPTIIQATSIKITNSTIEDALQAVTADQYSTYYIKNNIFNNNWKGIVQNGGVTGPIIGNTFKCGSTFLSTACDGILKPNCCGYIKSNTGIELNGVLSSHIGTDGGNTFMCMDKYGINSETSSVDIENNIFTDNFQQPNGIGWSVYCYSNSIITNTTSQIVGNNFKNTPTTNNAYAIFCRENNIASGATYDVKKNKITNFTFGIFGENLEYPTIHNHQFPVGFITIQNNPIINATGINLLNCNNAQVHHNQISSIAASAASFPSNFGITMNGCTSSVLNPPTIVYCNNLSNLGAGIAVYNWAFGCTNCGLQIEGNDFTSGSAYYQVYLNNVYIGLSDQGTLLVPCDNHWSSSCVYNTFADAGSNMGGNYTNFNCRPGIGNFPATNGNSGSFPCTPSPFSTYTGNDFCYLLPPRLESKNNNTNYHFGILYPNPNNGNMQYDYFLDKNEIGKFIIYDLNSNVLINYLLSEGSNSLQINQENLDNGIYLYRVYINDKISKFDKLVIIK